WLVAVLYYWLSMRPHLNSPELVVLNGNLKKVGMYWSNCDSTFEDWTEGCVIFDINRAKRNFWLMTTFLSVLSVLGTLLLIAMFMTGQPRLERNAFQSRLAREPGLSVDEVRALVEEIKSFI